MHLNTSDIQKVNEIISSYDSKMDISIHIPFAEYQSRFERVWEKMKEQSIDIGFFFWYREMPGDGVYLTGYNPTIERASGRDSTRETTHVISWSRIRYIIKRGWIKSRNVFCR